MRQVKTNCERGKTKGVAVQRRCVEDMGLNARNNKRGGVCLHTLLQSVLRRHITVAIAVKALADERHDALVFLVPERRSLTDVLRTEGADRSRTLP